MMQYKLMLNEAQRNILLCVLAVAKRQYEANVNDPVLGAGHRRRADLTEQVFQLVDNCEGEDVPAARIVVT
jgi:hypothetical protein